MKDVLARAAAKGLLDGVELGKPSKREKKKKSKTTLPKASATNTNSIQLKIAAFLNREANANTNRSETPTTKTPLAQKSTTQVSSSSQVRKPKPAASPWVPAFVKNTPPSRPYERRSNVVRPRPEDRMVVLKPVEIVLPPVTFPYAVPQGIRPQALAPRFYYRWAGPKPVMSGYLPTTSLTRKGEKPKTSPSSLLRHCRPWL